MRPWKSSRLSRAAAERLLEGQDGPTPLAQLLAAAASPGTATELRNEHVARAAFSSSASSHPLMAASPRNTRRRAATFSRVMVAKAVAAIALTAGAGGVAIAATGTSGPLSGAARGSETVNTAEPSVATAVGGPGLDGNPYADQRPLPRVAGPDGSGAEGDRATALCRAWLAGASENNGRADSSPAHSALAEAAGPAGIESYCAAVHAEREVAPPTGRPGQPTDAEHLTGKPSNRTGPPTSAPGNPDHPTGSAGGKAGGPNGSAADDATRRDDSTEKNDQPGEKAKEQQTASDDPPDSAFDNQPERTRKDDRN
jgi:hypothetical protein